MAARSGMTDLITRLRDLAADRWRLYQETATGDGSQQVFWLSHSPQATGGTVSVGGVVQGTTAYTWDTTYGRLALATVLPAGTALAVEYRQAQYGDDELQTILDGQATQVERRPLAWQPDTVAGSPVYRRATLGLRDLEGTASAGAYWTLADAAGQAATGYELDAVTGQVTFAADQGGQALYWTGRSYDLWAAAAEVWERKAGACADWYSFAAGDQRHERQQAYEHCRLQAKECRSRAGANRQRGELHAGAFQRTDLNPTGRG